MGVETSVSCDRCKKSLRVLGLEKWFDLRVWKTNMPESGDYFARVILCDFCYNEKARMGWEL